jgi:hypothetical protein
MYGLMSDLSPMWDRLEQWTSPMSLIGAALLAFLLVVHVAALSLVARAPELSEGAPASRKGARRKDEGHDRADSGHEIRSGGAVERSAAGGVRLARVGRGARG